MLIDLMEQTIRQQCRKRHQNARLRHITSRGEHRSRTRRFAAEHRHGATCDIVARGTQRRRCRVILNTTRAGRRPGGQIGRAPFLTARCKRPSFTVR
jgi:hypothetical protein